MKSMHDLYRMGFIGMNLKAAMQQSGCPICHVCRKSETHYLKSLFEYISSDFNTRILISGFCRRHAWQLLDMEVSAWGVPMGNSIVYEDLVREVRKEIETPLSLIIKSNNKNKWWIIIHRFLNRLTIPKGKGVVAFRARKPCRVCELSMEKAVHSAKALVRMLSKSEFQVFYSTSDGVCLPHLWEILASGETNPGLLFLLTDIRDRLRILENELNEFVRKQSWQYRDEKITEPERTAVKRAVAFFTGDPEDTLKTFQYRGKFHEDMEK